MKKNKLLPAVVLSISAIQSVVPMVASASLFTAKSVSGGDSDNTPAVQRFQAEHQRVEPAGLHEFEKAVAEQSGFSLAMLPRCGTISGSGQSWDDSAQDC